MLLSLGKPIIVVACRLRSAPPFPSCSHMNAPPISLTDDPLLARLNPPQHQAVMTTQGPVLMLAGAGTGKTAALTARLSWLVRQRLAWPSEILCVTFTNKAAREMRHRVGAMIGPAVENMPWLGTFHAIAAKMLRRHAELVGLHSNYTIIDTDDQLRVLKQLVRAEGIDDKRWPPKHLAGLIDRWKNKGLSPADIDAAESEAYAEGKGQHFYRLYQERLKAINACDFGDLLLHMLTILRGHRDVLEHYQQRFKYILVDEYQDTNQVQYLWLRLLAQAHKNICVVGDDDQSVYSWRGAEVANILKFEKDFPGCTVIRLEQNYRSTPQILAAASGLIAANSQRLGKTLWTEAHAGDPVRVISVWDAPEEARRVGEEIERLEREGAPLDRVAILVRAQHQTREFEDRFITIGVPYRIVGGFRFYERAEVRDALAYLRLIGQSADDLAFERIVNMPKRGLGDKAMERLHRLARAQAVSLAKAAASIADSDELPAKARNTLLAFARDCARWRDLAQTSSPAELVRVVLDESGYTAMLQAEKSVESAGRLENLSELARAMEEYETLGDFLEHVSLVMDNDAASDDVKVTIMTIHAAKGLEFDHVFLPGWEEGLFPSQRSMDEGGLASLEEERRLAYVAITRARRRCTILNAANRRIYGQWTSSIPSRFIAELPAEHVAVESTIAGGSSLWGGYASPPKSKSVGMVSAKPRADIAVGARVFHEKFGYGAVLAQDGNKLEIDFGDAGHKRVMDSFVRVEA